MEPQRTPLLDPNEIARTQRFIIRLGKTMHAYGTNSYHLERLLSEATYLLGLNGSFLVNPTSMNFIFWLDDDINESQTTHIARVKPGDIDLNRLALTHDLAEQVLAHEIDLDEGIKQLDEIRATSNVYHPFVQFLARGATAASFAGVCGTGLLDIVVALFLGWVVYLLVLFSNKNQRMEEMLEPASALVVGFLASAIAAYGLNIHLGVVVVSGVIAFIPGLSLTLGLRELAARDLLSGTARIMDAVMMMFKLYFGAAFGLALGTLFWQIDPRVEDPSLALWIHYLSVLGLTSSLIIVFNVRLSDAFWALLCGIIAYLFLLIGNSYFGEELGSMVAAMAAGLFANVYARVKRTPSNVALLPGIIVLVPGSKAFIGLNTMISGQEIVTNAASSSQVFIIFMSLVAGLIFANVVLPPRSRILRAC